MDKPSFQYKLTDQFDLDINQSNNTEAVTTKVTKPVSRPTFNEYDPIGFKFLFAILSVGIILYFMDTTVNSRLSYNGKRYARF